MLGVWLRRNRERIPISKHRIPARRRYSYVKFGVYGSGSQQLNQTPGLEDPHQHYHGCSKEQLSQNVSLALRAHV